jgi:hypothetical protein
MHKKESSKIFISGKELEAEVVSKSCIYSTSLRALALRKDEHSSNSGFCHLIFM